MVERRSVRDISRACREPNRQMVMRLVMLMVNLAGQFPGQTGGQMGGQADGRLETDRSIGAGAKEAVGTWAREIAAAWSGVEGWGYGESNVQIGPPPGPADSGTLGIDERSGQCQP